MSTGALESTVYDVPGQHIRHYFRGTSGKQSEELRLSVKKYTPRKADERGDVTIIAAPAVGIPKEAYEPLWNSIHEYMQKRGRGIRNVWIADYVNQGASAALNKGKLGTDLSFDDHSRDYLAIVNHFREEMTLPIIGIGHSLGAVALTNLALMHPRLLCSISLVEPVLNHVPTDLVTFGLAAVTFRKDTWPSKEAAIKELSKMPQYRRWDARCLELFKRHGLVEVDRTRNPEVAKGTVTLATTRHQEAFTVGREIFPRNDQKDPPRFSHPDANDTTRLPGTRFYRPEPILTSERLPHLRPSCQFVYGAASNYSLKAAQANRARRLEMTGSGVNGSGGPPEGQVSEIYVAGGTHSVPQEKPEELASTLVEWFDASLRRWDEEQREEWQSWSAIDPEKRDITSEEWRYWAQDGVKKLKQQKASKDQSGERSKGKL